MTPTCLSYNDAAQAAPIPGPAGRSYTLTTPGDAPEHLCFTRDDGETWRFHMTLNPPLGTLLPHEADSLLSRAELVVLLDALFSRVGAPLGVIRLGVGPDGARQLPHPQPHHVAEDAEPVITRTAFYQWPHWTAAGDAYPFPETQTRTGDVTHPLRPPRPDGEVYRRYQHGLGKTLSFRVASDRDDLETFHRWMNDPRVADAWELAGDKAAHAAYLRGQRANPKQYPLMGMFDDRVFGYFEVYWTPEDRLGPYYAARPYDRGLHLLVGEPDFLGKAYTTAWLKGLTHYLFLDDPRTGFIMGEPRADNQRILRYTRYLPYRKLFAFDFPHKRAVLMECARRDFFEQVVL